MLAVFGQGKDVIRTLHFDLNDPERTRHTVFLFFFLVLWGWGNWRSTRLITHIKTFDFSEFYRTYAVRTLVIIPRLLAVLPFVIIIYATINSSKGYSYLLIIYIILAVSVYTFLVYRRKLIVFLKTKDYLLSFLIDYIPVKSESYPVSFLYSKQKWWIYIRLIFTALFFLLVFLFPISFSRFIGSAGLVIAATIVWMTIFTHLTILEYRFKFPIIFFCFLCWFAFSFINNNHAIRTTKTIVDDSRMPIDDYISLWLDKKCKTNDTTNVYLIASEGGGARAALWTYEVLKELTTKIPDFKNNILAYSSVSGGSLGTIAYDFTKKKIDDKKVQTSASKFLNNDFLSPIMAFAMFPDALQRFLPFPLKQLDRASILEKTWENDWTNSFESNSSLNSFRTGFLDYSISLNSNPDAMIFLNSTHIETGKRILISPVKFTQDQFFETTDLLNITGKDVSFSTSALLSARFPYLTPAGLIFDKENKIWGNAGDGGYYENLGISTLLDIYSRLSIVSQKKNKNIRIKLIFIRNNKDYSLTKPLGGMYEFMSPIIGYLNVWYKSGTYNMNLIKHTSLRKTDKIYNIMLPRFQGDIIPLGWSLSVYASKYITESASKVVQYELKK
ncbi:MAG: hypothetical protein IT243_03390 [Bacteroidia bacterium]|nr:hypothetical protein [Bacteroidia bacterium]